VTTVNEEDKQVINSLKTVEVLLEFVNDGLQQALQAKNLNKAPLACYKLLRRS